MLRQVHFGMGDSADTRRPAQQVLATLVIFCAVLFVQSAARAADLGDVSATVPLATAGVDFAIADFDGDSLPVFATVQPGPFFASRANYFIRVAYSVGNQRSFPVLAPAGGLQ